MRLVIRPSGYVVALGLRWPCTPPESTSPTLSNCGVGSFTSHMNQISESAVSLDLRLFVLIRED